MATAQSSFPGTGTDIDWRSINAIRFLSIDAVQKANSGHPGAPMGCAPLAYVLWQEALKHNPGNPDWPDRDRFVLSNGHASMLLYSLLHLTGYDLSLEEIKNFRQWGSQTPGHPERGVAPGVEATTGPLGQGFANGVGMAIAERILANTYNRPGHEIINHRTYALVSDGDLQEGVQSEAASLAGTLELGKLIYFYDDNEISIEGDTDVTFREDVPARFRAYGWQVLGPVDGNDLKGLRSVLDEARSDDSRPTLIVVNTVIGFGSPNKAGSEDAHGAALGDDEVELTRKSLGWDLPPFEVPEEVYGQMRATGRGAEAEAEWNRRFAEYENEYPELAVQLKADLAGDLPTGWESELDALVDAFDKPVATRAVSGKAIEAIVKKLPRLVGGSADLAGSNNTTVPGRESFLPENHGGRTVHFGVREHAMGAVCNGIALHGGVLPYGGTFLIFSDYMRAAVRVGALTELHTIWVYTHDSIGLGEDGPTHQPISQLMGLRLIPNLTVIRPADANETLEAWRIAVLNEHGPVALALTRQGLPSLESLGATAAAQGNVQRGGYVVKDADGTPDAILIATGSEVQVALRATEQLANYDIKTRVVSMPSWDLFDAQPRAYRDSVLPPDIRARVSVEAGTTIGWEHYIGLDGQAVGMEGFGASSPGGVAMEKFGFTPDNVADVARDVVARTRK